METIFLTALLILLVVGLLILARPRLGMIVALVTSGGLFAWGIVEESLLLVCLSPLLLLVVLLLVVVVKILRHQPVIQRRGFRWWVVLGIPAVVILGVALIVTRSPWLILWLALVVVWTISAAIYGMTHHGWATLQVFSLLGSAMRQNLPLTVALENAASGRHDYLGSVLWEIHAWLVQGHDLSDALERGYAQCPRHLLAMVKVAQKNHQLPQTFGVIEQDLQAGLRWRNLVDTDPGAYPLVILIIMYFELMGLLKFVMPQFKCIYMEMIGEARQMPWPTRVLMDLSFDGVSVMQLVGFLLAGILIMNFIGWLRPRSGVSQGWLRPVSERCRWYVPGLGRIEQTLSMLQVTSALRLGLQGGETIDGVVGHVLGLDINVVLKRRLQRWHASITSGMNVSQAARRCHLGRALAWAFDSDLNAGQAPQILASLEAMLRARHRYLRVVLHSILNPCVTIGLALVVGFVVLAIFLPGVGIIAAMADMVYP